MMEEESDTEDTLEAAQNDIAREAERQRALRTREAPSEKAERLKKRTTNQEAAERQLRKGIVIPPNISSTREDATPIHQIPVNIKCQRKVVREIG